MHLPDMFVEVAPIWKRPPTVNVSADETFSKVSRLVVLTHVLDASEHLVTRFLVAGHILGTLNTIRWRSLLLAALGNMGVVVILRRKRSTTS